jgi:hypothetical protein
MSAARRRQDDIVNLLPACLRLSGVCLHGREILLVLQSSIMCPQTLLCTPRLRDEP